MKWRPLLKAAAIFTVGAMAGYLTAYGSGAPVPSFLTSLRFNAHAAVDEAKLRAALRASKHSIRHAVTTMGRGGAIAAGTTLAEAIRFSRLQALRGTVRPLTPYMKELYRPYFPDELLEKTRWTLAGRRPGLGSVLAGWYYKEGAVTLGNVIVFSNMSAARHRALVAHELTHVLQYEQLGVADFARLYVQNWPLLEGQARRHAGRVIADLERDEPPPLLDDQLLDSIEGVGRPDLPSDGSSPSPAMEEATVGKAESSSGADRDQ